jgi:hypothetical protein|uniref:LINE-1 reverse transcriptase n=1 Tax=Sipha flava TaxID=143950 RepID=A0A2S2QHV4_9HEMI
MALFKCNSKSPGADGIRFSFLHNLPMIGKTYLLQIFNLIWYSGIIPLSWKHSCIIPIPKEGRDKFNASGYRPISLLNTMCKLMEKVINLRFMWFIKQINYLSLDYLKNTTKNKQTLGIVCFDIVKAYDTAWRPPLYRNFKNSYVKELCLSLS